MNRRRSARSNGGTPRLRTADARCLKRSSMASTSRSSSGTLTTIATVLPVKATLTADLERAKADLAEHGYCLLEGLCPTDRVAELRGRLDQLARDEVAAGTDYVYENGSNQRVWTLLNKG